MHKYMHVHKYMHKHKYMNMHKYMHMHKYIHMQKFISIKAYIYTYFHTISINQTNAPPKKVLHSHECVASP